jgi:plastocyanin
MSRSEARAAGIVVAAAGAFFAFTSGLAQTVCITPNCVFAGSPPECANLAAPRIPTVLMGSGINNIFIPANPKIEPGDCILWRAATSTHSSTGSLCADDPLCGSVAPPACQFDSANVSSASATPTSICFYSPGSFPAGTGTGYFCRIHATATTGTMRGNLQVTTPIQLTVDKDLGTNSVKLSWTGGGVAGDVSFKVARQTGGDPKFPTGSTTTVSPTGGVLGTTFVDSGDLLNPATRYYLVRNKQTNES